MATLPRFILGRAGSGKTTTIVREVAALLGDDPLGEPIFVLVPDQATLLYERLIADASPTAGYVRLCVITFRQLTEMLLREGGGASVPEVTPVGRRILIGRLLRRLQPQLDFYGSSARQPGLADRLDDAFAEIEHGELSDADLAALAADVAATSPQSTLPAKLRDICLLAGEYARLLGSDRLDQHRRQRQALASAKASATLPKARLYVDAFDEFTRTERRLLAEIATTGCALTIALDMDPADATPAARELAEDHPFRAATFSHRRLDRSFRELGRPASVVALTTAPRFTSSDLLQLSKQFMNARPGPIAPAGDVRLIEAPGRRAEVDAAARQILDWLRAGFRLRDVLVLARDVNGYARHIERSFAEHGLAHFIDRQQPAGHHPLVRTVRSLMQVALSDFQHAAIIELTKAGLVGLNDAATDALESYLVAHRIRGGAAWRERWTFRRTRLDDDEAIQTVNEETDRINAARAHLANGLEPLQECDDANLCTATQWCQRLCKSLDRLGANAALAALIRRAEDAGDVDATLRHRQVWAEFGELLDQLAAVLDGESLSLRDFAEVIDVALERFVLAIVPPTIDQVLVGGVQRTRSATVRGCIVLGLSEGIFPLRQEQVGAISDDDRRLLADRNVELRVGSRAAQLDEQTLAYKAFTRASEQLVVTRSTQDDEGRPLAPSMYWTQLRAIYRPIIEATVACVTAAACVATPRQLAEAIVDWTTSDAERASPASTQLAAWALRTERADVVALRDTVARATRYHNRAALSAATAAALYASPLRTSATRLETFAACPFKHFAQHALRLSVEAESQLTPIDLGIVYHRVLERLVRRAIAERHDLATPLPGLSLRLAALGEEAAAELRGELALSPGRHAYLIDGVRETLEDVVETQRLALAFGGFRPTQTEFAFGLDDEHAPPLEIVTPKGRSVALRGKIDRVDTIALTDRLAATVVDYKLGKRTASFDHIYYGLSLQLITYLLVLTALGKRLTGRDVAPAAAFYVRLLRHVEAIAHPDDAEPADADSFHLTNANKPRGVIDENFVGDLDAVTERGASAAYALRKTGEPIELRRNDVLDHTTFRSLVEWTRAKIAALGDRIIDGHVEVRPYRLRTVTPCSTCSYRSVCRLDLSFNQYNWVRPMGAVRLKQIVEETNR